MSQQGKRKTKRFFEIVYKNKLNVFLRRLLYALSQFLCSLARFDLATRGVRQRVQPHTFYTRLLVFGKTLAQPDFAVANSSDAVMSLFHSPVLTCCLIFLKL